MNWLIEKLNYYDHISDCSSLRWVISAPSHTHTHTHTHTKASKRNCVKTIISNVPSGSHKFVQYSSWNEEYHLDFPRNNPSQPSSFPRTQQRRHCDFNLKHSSISLVFSPWSLCLAYTVITRRNHSNNPEFCVSAKVHRNCVRIGLLHASFAASQNSFPVTGSTILS